MANDPTTTPAKGGWRNTTGPCPCGADAGVDHWCTGTRRRRGPDAVVEEAIAERISGLHCFVGDRTYTLDEVTDVWTVAREALVALRVEGLERWGGIEP